MPNSIGYPPSHFSSAYHPLPPVPCQPAGSGTAFFPGTSIPITPTQGPGRSRRLVLSRSLVVFPRQSLPRGRSAFHRYRRFHTPTLSDTPSPPQFLSPTTTRHSLIRLRRRPQNSSLRLSTTPELNRIMRELAAQPTLSSARSGRPDSRGRLSQVGVDNRAGNRRRRVRSIDPDR